MSENLAGEALRAVPRVDIERHMRLRIKYMHPKALTANKNLIERVQRFPERSRRGFANLPPKLMSIAYDLIKDRLGEA